MLVFGNSCWIFQHCGLGKTTFFRFYTSHFRLKSFPRSILGCFEKKKSIQIHFSTLLSPKELVPSKSHYLNEKSNNNRLLSQENSQHQPQNSYIKNLFMHQTSHCHPLHNHSKHTTSTTQSQTNNPKHERPLTTRPKQHMFLKKCG